MIFHYAYAIAFMPLMPLLPILPLMPLLRFTMLTGADTVYADDAIFALRHAFRLRCQRWRCLSYAPRC